MNPRVHDTARKMGVDGPRGRTGTSRRPFRALPVGAVTQGSAFGSTLGYVPAASRLNVLAVLPDTYIMHITLEGRFSEESAAHGPAH